MIKRSCKVSILLIVMLFLTNIVFAQSTNFKSRETLNAFIKYMNNGGSNIFDYIDRSNTELENNINQYLGTVSMNLNVTKIEERDDYSNISGTLTAHGDNWSCEGITVKFEFKKINDKYLLTDTTLFDHIGSANIEDFTKVMAILLFNTILGSCIVIAFLVWISIKISNKQNQKL